MKLYSSELRPCGLAASKIILLESARKCFCRARLHLSAAGAALWWKNSPVSLLATVYIYTVGVGAKAATH